MAVRIWHPAPTWLFAAWLLTLLVTAIAVYAAFVGSAAKAAIALGVSARGALVVTVATFAGTLALFLTPDIKRWWTRRRRSLG